MLYKSLLYLFCFISGTTSGAKSEKIVFGGITMSYGKKCFVSNLVKFPTLFQRTCFLIKLYNKYIDSF